MVDGAGVPSGAGVAALESDALSPFEALAASWVAEGAGESTTSLVSLMGDSSLMDWGSTISRSFAGDTVSLTSRVGLLLDFRRASMDFDGGAMVESAVVSCSNNDDLMEMRRWQRRG